MAKLHKDPSRTDLIDKFNNTYRYLEDIFSVNNSDFYRYTSEIYPKELTLNKANNNSLKCTLLDLDVKILLSLGGRRPYPASVCPSS